MLENFTSFFYFCRIKTNKAMKFNYLLIILFFASSLALPAQSRPETIEKHLEAVKENPDNHESLLFLCEHYLMLGDYSKVVTYAEYLKNQASTHQSPSTKLNAHLYLGQAQMKSGREKAARKNLDAALDLASRQKNDTLLCTLYGTLGEYAAHIDADYYQAIRWIYKGIELAQQKHLHRQYGLLLSQLANTYYLKRDAGGLKYALESHELGRQLKDNYLTYSGAIQSAYMYFLNKQHPQAMAYVQEAEELMTRNGFYDQAHTYNLLGQLLDELGNYPQATEYYQKAMKDKQGSQTSSVVYAHLGYARMLMKQKKHAEAIALLKQGIAISQARTNAVHRNELYETLSLCYEQLHQYREALTAYKHFRIENDSIFSEYKERDLSEMRYRYDTERQENLIKQSKLEMIQKEQYLQQLTSVLAIIVIVLGLLYYLYRRKNKLYLSIVKQNQEAIKRESALNRRIHELENRQTSTEKYASSSLSDEKSLELFHQLEKMMREDQIYKDKTISKDKVAELLNTNRTYLSRIINEHASTSFTHYVNRFRTEEAVRQISDPTNDIPLKALAGDLGFNSLSTFYNLFQASVGMTPAQYRSKVKELEKHR